MAKSQKCEADEESSMASAIFGAHSTAQCGRGKGTAASASYEHDGLDSCPDVFNASEYQGQR